MQLGRNPPRLISLGKLRGELRRTKRLDPIESGRIVPQDLSPRRLRQMSIIGELPYGAIGKLLRRVSMRIVGGHDQVVVAYMLHEAADQLFTGLAADHALPLPVDAWQLSCGALSAQSVVLPVFVHPLQPVWEPPAS